MTVHRVIGHKSDNTRIAMEDKILKMAGFKDGDVICQWFVRTKMKSSTFKTEMLIKLDE